MSQPIVHSFHVIFNTTKFHFNRDMDNGLKFSVMKTELYAIILTIFIYITHVPLFCLFSKAVHSLRESRVSGNYTLQIRRTSTVPPCGSYSVNISGVPGTQPFGYRQENKTQTGENKQ